jgi:beta-glucosidase
MSSNVDERTGRELYEAPYRAAVDAGVGSVMCSFNRINTTYSCANDEGLNKWLKKDLGFDGFVVSDWGAQHGTVDFALGGLDQEQEWVKNATYYGPLLAAAVANGSVPLARLDDMAFRVLLPMLALNYLAPSPPSANPNATANTTEHAALAHELSAASLVLLTNENHLLPLPNTSITIAVIGYDQQTGGGGSGRVVAPYSVAIADAVRAEFPAATVAYYNGQNITAAAALAAASDVTVFLASVWSGEGSDRANLSLGCAPWAGAQSCRWWPDQDATLEVVAAAAGGRVVVALRAPGAVLMPWLPSVGAVVNQLYGGQDANAVLAGALSGRYNPSGKLTVSFPASMEDTWLSYPAASGPVNPASFPGVDRGGGFLEATYAEGLQVGYRWFDARGTRPLFFFGHGLSYSNFTYSRLLVSNPLSPATPTCNVTFVMVLSNGPAGGEVAQLYVQSFREGDPPKALKGFAYVHLSPEAPSAEVDIPLALEDLRTWDVAAHAWATYPPGAFTLWVGASSADLRLAGSVVVSE